MLASAMLSNDVINHQGPWALAAIFVRALLFPERDHRIQTRGPLCRQIACSERNHGHKSNRSGERNRIAALQTEEHLLSRLADDQRQPCSDLQAGRKLNSSCPH